MGDSIVSLPDHCLFIYFTDRRGLGVHGRLHNVGSRVYSEILYHILINKCTLENRCTTKIQ